MTRNEMIRQLQIHLVSNGMTFSNENGDPLVTRPMRAEVLVGEILDYLIGVGHVNPDRA
jgi:hypothetical protein